MKSRDVSFGVFLLLVLATPLLAAPDDVVPQLGRAYLPGRQVRVSAISIGLGGDHDAKLALAVDHPRTAGQNSVDIVFWPSAYRGGSPLDAMAWWAGSSACQWKPRQENKGE